jgi:universal stress protein E
VYPIRRILVSIKDPGARQFPVLAKVAQLARALEAEVCLFHAMTGPIYLEGVALDEPLPQLAQKAGATDRGHLERLAKPLRSRGLKVTTVAEWDFPAHEAIIRAAAHFDAQLIVAEAHRTAHRAPWLLHFTDWELLRNSTLPVLLVKTQRPYRRPKVLAAVDPSHANAKPADLDEEILGFGSTLANALRGALHVVHACDALLVGMSAEELAAPRGIAKAQAKAVARARAALDPKLKSIGLARGRRHIADGFPVDVIQNVARKIRAEMTVMGAVSRSGLKRLFIGNTAERMLDRMTCDVLIVKPKQFRNRIASAARGPRVVAATLVPGS